MWQRCTLLRALSRLSPWLAGALPHLQLWTWQAWQGCGPVTIFRCIPAMAHPRMRCSSTPRPCSVSASQRSSSQQSGCGSTRPSPLPCPVQPLCPFLLRERHCENETTYPMCVSEVTQAPAEEIRQSFIGRLLPALLTSFALLPPPVLVRTAETLQAVRQPGLNAIYDAHPGPIHLRACVRAFGWVGAGGWVECASMGAHNTAHPPWGMCTQAHLCLCHSPATPRQAGPSARPLPRAFGPGGKGWSWWRWPCPPPSSQSGRRWGGWRGSRSPSPCRGALGMARGPPPTLRPRDWATVFLPELAGA